MPMAPDGTPLPYAEDVQGGGPADYIRAMLEIANAYRQVEQDDEDLLGMEQATSILQKLLAKEQKMGDDLIAGKASPQALRRFG